MKRLILSLVLTFVLATTALAGDIPSGGIAPPPPPSDGMQASTTTVPGDIPSGGGLTYEIADTALDLFQMLLSAGI